VANLFDAEEGWNRVWGVRGGVWGLHGDPTNCCQLHEPEPAHGFAWAHTVPQVPIERATTVRDRRGSV